MAKTVEAIEIMQRYGALGPDFLTWLSVGAMNSTLPMPPAEPGLVVRVLGPMVFTAEQAEVTKASFAGEDAALSPEAAAALAAGKRLVRARLELTAQDATWSFTLDAESFDLKSLKLPVPKVPDLDEYLALRVQATQQVAFLVQQLFELFLPIRCDKQQWAAEVKGWRSLGK